MHSINDYAKDLNLALIDAADNPAFREFMDAGDFEMIAVDQGDGTQKQVQALSRRSVKKVIEKIIARAREKGVDMKNWICSSADKGGFDLCSKLDTPIGQLMRDLDAFLKKRWAEGGLVVAGVLAIAANPAVGTFLAIFSAIGFINKAFVELCDCPR
jgi:hypothetical protein